MVFHETLEAQQKSDELDQAYEKNTWEWYKKAKEDKLGFYWKFKKPEKKENITTKNIIEKTQDNFNNKTNWISENNNLKIDWQENEKIEISKQEIKNLENKIDNQNNINYPIINWLYTNEKITKETYINLLKNIEINPNKKLWDLLKDIKINNTKDKKELEKITKNSPQKNIENFNKILKENNIEWLDKIKNVINNKANDSIYQEVHNLIWSNFIEIDKQNNNPQRDIKIAIKSAWSNVINKYPSIKKMSDSQIYKNAFNDIKSGNIKSWVEGIKTLLLLGSTIAYAWWKLKEKQKLKAKWIIEWKYKERLDIINQELLKINQELKNKKNNTELLKQKENLIKEKKEITTWEIFSKAWKIDKNKANIEKETKK